MKQLREVAVKHLITYSFLPPVIGALLWVTLSLWVLPRTEGIVQGAVLVVAAVISYLLLERTVIGIVLLYKAFAPEKVRARCRFTPTCSTYMILAINKYGLIRGVIKGIRRLLRCKPPNGGVDYP